MKIKIDRQVVGQLSFSFEPDEQDAFLPVNRVFIRHPGVEKINDARIALISYFLASDFTCNVLEIEGVAWPPYLASAMVGTTAGHELFPCPVSNTPQKIIPEFRYAGLASPNQTSEGWLSMSRYELGREVHGLPLAGGQEVLPVHTNIDFFSSFLAGSAILADVITYLSMMDAFGVEALRLSATTDAKRFGDIQHLVAEVGGRIEWVGGVA